jgi:predicted phage terminase large subunit-like protein
MNKYIVVDPASSKKKTSDYTAIFVIGAASDNNFYVLDMVRDRLNLTERADAVFALHRRWKPVLVGYERYGMMGDIEHIKQRQQDEKYHFPITELGGKVAKVDRIRRLIPVFEQGRVFLPVELSKRDYEGREVDLINVFVNDEFTAFPVAAHDDMLDALSRIMDTDLGIRFPVAAMQSAKTDRYARRQRYNRGSAWAV